MKLNKPAEIGYYSADSLDTYDKEIKKVKDFEREVFQKLNDIKKRTENEQKRKEQE